MHSHLWNHAHRPSKSQVGRPLNSFLCCSVLKTEYIMTGALPSRWLSQTRQPKSSRGIATSLKLIATSKAYCSTFTPLRSPKLHDNYGANFLNITSPPHSSNLRQVCNLCTRVEPRQDLLLRNWPVLLPRVYFGFATILQTHAAALRCTHSARARLSYGGRPIAWY